MGTYSYEELRRAAKKARARMAEEGRHIEKGVRRKPRDPGERGLLFQRAIERIKRYPPLKTDDGLVLPYFMEQPGERQ